MTVDLLLSKAIEVFLIARLSDSYSKATISQYKWALDRFVNQEDKSLSHITTADIRRFLAYLQTDYQPVRPGGNAAPLGSASIFAAWKAIRAFYKWASPELGIENPSAKIPPPKHMSAVIIPLSQEEIKLLLRACEKLKTTTTDKRQSYTMTRPTASRDRAILLTLLDTGLRVGELCRLKVSDCNLRTGEIVVNPIGSGVKSRARVVPLGASSRKAISLYLALDNTDENAPLFQKDEGGFMDRGNVLHSLVGLGKRAGVRNVHPHRVRHTFAIQYLRNGGDVFSLQRILGHTTLTMTQHYLALANADDAEAHRRASPVDMWKL